MKQAEAILALLYPIEQAIMRLPETQRMALVLRRYQEMSYEEIAATLGLSVPAVKSLLFRARTELRERLRDYLEQLAGKTALVTGDASGIGHMLSVRSAGCGPCLNSNLDGLHTCSDA